MLRQALRVQSFRFSSLWNAFPNATVKPINTLPQSRIASQMSKRAIFMWVENIFNRVDSSRVEAVGPDRAAAEFVLRMGGRILMQGAKDWVDRESLLPAEDTKIQLLSISLPDSTVTDVGMEHFRNLKHLEELDLGGNKFFTDSALSMVTTSPIARLILRETLITDKSVPILSKFETLQALDVSKTKIGSSGISQLKQTLPKCTIVH